MFTGIITGVGRIAAIRHSSNSQDARFIIEVPADNPIWSGIEHVALGASIACSGCCLTVVERDARSFAVDVSAESLAKTTLRAWKIGDQVNLERAARLGDELGGHIVSGHVDGLAEVVSSVPENGSVRWQFRLPDDLARFVAPKGSITINGVSLTVNEVQGTVFGVNIIPHTSLVTNFATLAVGDKVNIEIDMLARYVARLAEFKS